MYSITLANREHHLEQIRDLSLEYLQWVNTKLYEYFGTGVDDVPKYVEEDLQHIDKFLPPLGRFFLCYVDERLAGMAALRKLDPGIGEIKRMYVRPEFRRRGLGRALFNRLVEEAYLMNFQCLRLDSAPFFVEAHQLYRSSGFQDIEPYQGAEIPKEFHGNWFFYGKTITEKRGEISLITFRPRLFLAGIATLLPDGSPQFFRCLLNQRLSEQVSILDDTPWPKAVIGS